ncbi:ribonuclease D [Sulfuricaulis limicola]|uniref:Ribonuclease D n=1 Tax=Sulfuricaulis limicola TaxID=1620215 RepID=A0A1B4XC54_9GAMM|nr:ribonuclease D [Sulfuricaulis limicola]BAV32361.1 ribonuclease D [Sulfuricaulis limicola]
MTESLVQDPAALARSCEALRAQAWMALDTEFMRTRTYYARLCLVQVATPEQIACVDTITLPTIEPLLEMIYAPHTLKVVHAARQDLEVFADIRGAPPAPVFDTQIAASLCGYDDQIGYGALVESITGHKLPKLHTRADWETRPLPADQLHYAEDDVRYLRDVYRFLAQKLEALGRTDWLREECAALTDPGLYRNDPREAWRRLKQGQSLPPAAQTLLRELAMWRELTAQQHNLPRGWVVADTALVEAALVAPTAPEALGRIAGIGGPPARKWGEEILQVIQHGLELKPERLWEEPQRPDRRQQALYEQLQTRVRAVAAEIKISATLIAPRRELLKLIAGDSSGSLARGWRRALIGEELMQLCGNPAAATAT